MIIVLDTNVIKEFIANEKELNEKYTYAIHFSSFREMIDSYINEEDYCIKIDKLYKYLIDNSFIIATNFGDENSNFNLNEFICKGKPSKYYYEVKLKDCEYNASIIINFYIVMETLWITIYLGFCQMDNGILKKDINNERYNNIQNSIMCSIYHIKTAKDFKLFYYSFLHNNIVTLLKKYNCNNVLIDKLLQINDLEEHYSVVNNKKAIDNIKINWKPLFIKRIENLDNIIFKKYLEKLFDKYFINCGKIQINAIIDARVVSLANKETVILTDDKEMKKFIIDNSFNSDIYFNIYNEFGYRYNN